MEIPSLQKLSARLLAKQMLSGEEVQLENAPLEVQQILLETILQNKTSNDELIDLMGRFTLLDNIKIEQRAISPSLLVSFQEKQLYSLSLTLCKIERAALRALPSSLHSLTLGGPTLLPAEGSTSSPLFSLADLETALDRLPHLRHLSLSFAFPVTNKTIQLIRKKAPLLKTLHISRATSFSYNACREVGKWEGLSLEISNCKEVSSKGCIAIIEKKKLFSFSVESCTAASSSLEEKRRPLLTKNTSSLNEEVLRIMSIA